MVFVRLGRIELPSHPWQGRVLPLNHNRKIYNFVFKKLLFEYYTITDFILQFLWNIFNKSV